MCPYAWRILHSQCVPGQHDPKTETLLPG
ncbi:hypothetical protein AVEN_172033-1, partial [Araneus ventricosus]